MVVDQEEEDHFKALLDLKVANNSSNNSLKWVVAAAVVHKLLFHQDMVILGLVKIKCEILFVKTIFAKEDSRGEVLPEEEVGLTMDHSICLKEVLVDLREDPDQCIMNPCNVT